MILTYCFNDISLLWWVWNTHSWKYCLPQPFIFYLPTHAFIASKFSQIFITSYFVQIPVCACVNCFFLSVRVSQFSFREWHLSQSLCGSDGLTSPPQPPNLFWAHDPVLANWKEHYHSQPLIPLPHPDHSDWFRISTWPSQGLLPQLLRDFSFHWGC